MPAGIIVPAFLQRSPPLLLTIAACSGLRPAPDCRPRRALLHLSYSCAPPDTQDSARDTRHSFSVQGRSGNGPLSGLIDPVYQYASAPMVAGRRCGGEKRRCATAFANLAGTSWSDLHPPKRCENALSVAPELEVQACPNNVDVEIAASEKIDAG